MSKRWSVDEIADMMKSLQRLQEFTALDFTHVTPEEHDKILHSCRDMYNRLAAIRSNSRRRGATMYLFSEKSEK